jgi:hypothetical protein
VLFQQAYFLPRAHWEALPGGLQTGRPEVVMDFDHVVKVVNKRCPSYLLKPGALNISKKSVNYLLPG